MKKLSFLLPVLLVICISAAVLSGCGGETQLPQTSQTTSPSPSATAEATATAKPTQTAGPTEAAGSPAPETTAGSTEKTGSIQGFMEGGIVDPDDVPEITALFTEGDNAGMSIQSITYKLYEGRQAYYVILQGVGIQDRAYYVFADGSMRDADMIPGD